MAYRDGLSGMQVVHLGNLTLSGATPAATDWVDTRGFDSVSFVAINNTVTDAGTTAGYSFELQESDTTADGDATAVAAGETLGSITDVTSDSADDAVAGGIGYVGDARYARLEATGTTNTDADVTVIAILRNAHTEPPTLIGTSVAAT